MSQEQEPGLRQKKTQGQETAYQSRSWPDMRSSGQPLAQQRRWRRGEDSGRGPDDEVGKELEFLFSLSWLLVSSITGFT